MRKAEEAAWVERRLGDVITLQRGFDLPTRQRRNGYIPVVTSSGTTARHDVAMVRGPGVVTGRYGTIGEVFYVESGFWPLNTTLFVSSFHGNDRKFAYYILKRVDFSSHSGKSGVPGVNRNDLHQLTVRIPESVAEQAYIARSLSDADELITTLERLIAKKQAIKQGMMQQLLTGKTRLPGFGGPWSEVRLGEVGTFLKGRGVKREDVLGAGVPCIRYGELYTAFTDYTSRMLSFVERDVAATALPIRTGDLLFAGSGETRAEIGKCVAYTGIATAVAGGDIIVLRGTTFNPVYVAMLTNTVTVAGQKAKRGQGDAVVHISSRALGDIELRLPSKDEQDAIAALLTDSDNEIRLLRYRLAKAKAVKLGMMQELLTGRTRLPVKEGAT